MKPFSKTDAGLYAAPYFSQLPTRAGVNVRLFLLLGLLLALWPVLQHFIAYTDPTAGALDPNIWLMLLFSLIAFLMLLGLSFWLVQYIWNGLSLPELEIMVSHFHKLQTWQQIKLYCACFAALLFAAVAVLSAII